jgi:predicted  nucleic acid-binding Zn-ribbon protein
VAAAASVSSGLVTVIVGAVLGSGILGGLYVALRKFSSGTYTVIASKELVDTAREIAGDLRKDLDDCRRQIAELQQQASLVDSLRRQVERLEGELDKAKDRERLLLEERDSLHQRVRDLEADVARLKTSNGNGK